jgi:hypothetical protein
MRYSGRAGMSPTGRKVVDSTIGVLPDCVLIINTLRSRSWKPDRNATWQLSLLPRSWSLGRNAEHWSSPWRQARAVHALRSDQFNLFVFWIIWNHLPILLATQHHLMTISPPQSWLPSFMNSLSMFYKKISFTKDKEGYLGRFCDYYFPFLT